MSSNTTTTTTTTVSVDIETLCSGYTGGAKVARLEHISFVCPSLARDALHSAVAACVASHSLNTDKYLALAAALHAIDSAFVADSLWLQNTVALAKSRTDKLEADLRNYKSNLIKESIRMGHQDLGDHFYACGDYANAFKHYSRTRDYCSTAKHILDMCLNVIKVSMAQKEYTIVQSFVAKAESTPDTTTTQQPLLSLQSPTVSSPSTDASSSRALLSWKLKCYMAVVWIESGRFKDAVKCLVEGVGDSIGGAIGFSEIISAPDIANYIVLLGLATFDRTELKTKIIDNPHVKPFLELAEPSLRDLLTGFYAARYGACFKALDMLKPLFVLDMYLYNHIPTLYAHIRRRAIIQYVSPFNVVDLRKMSALFPIDGDGNGVMSEAENLEALESELCGLIENGVFGSAKIDAYQKVLRRTNLEPRASVLTKTITMGQEYRRLVDFLLLRANLLRQDMIVENAHFDRDELKRAGVGGERDRERVGTGRQQQQQQHRF